MASIVSVRAGRVARLLPLALLLAATGASAQPDGLRIRDAFAGDCGVAVDLPPGADVAKLTVRLNDGELDRRQIAPSPGPTLPAIQRLSAPLKEGEKLEAKLGADRATTSVRASALGRAIFSGCQSPATQPPAWDDRDTFEASGYLGYVFDNFAPQSVGAYRNPDASTGIRSRFIGGVEAEYRLSPQNRRVQVWLAGKTLHGVRTADVDCSATPDLAVCRKDATFQDRFLYILEHATTLEGHFTPRVEFATIQPDSSFPVRVYAGARVGFIAVEGSPKLLQTNRVDLGLMATRTPFARSYVEVGWGKTDLFHENAGWNRLKIDGLLLVDVAPGLSPFGFFNRMGRATRMFIQIAIDQNPGGSGPDSVQTYVGMDFDFRRAFGGFLGR